MSDNYGNAADFDVDLHSIYAAYIGLFESSGIEWWDKSWGGYFASFGDFLGFGWEVMVVVDTDTSRAHIAVKRDQIALFARMIRTRFGESLPKYPPTTLPLHPVPTRTLALRRLVHITDLAGYRKLALTLTAAELSHTRSRVRHAEVGVAEQLFYAGDANKKSAGVRDNGVGYTWACVSTKWWEKGGPPSGLIPGFGHTRGKGGLVLEVGMAVMRCAHLRAVSVWPPVPQENYRKSHFIVEEWVDKRANTTARTYAFGSSRYVAEKSVEKIVDATIGALASQENDSLPNTLILLTVGEPAPLPVPASSTIPSNILHLDVLALEYRLLQRAQEQGVPGAPERRQPLTSLAALLQLLQIPVPPFAPLGNAGNEAFYTVLAFQKLMMAETHVPDVLFAPESFAYSSRSSQLFPTVPFVQSSFSMNVTPGTPELHSFPHNLPRAQTVFWDDAEFASQSRNVSHRERSKPNRLSSFDTSRIRPASMGFQREMPRSSSSRSVSFGVDANLDPPDRSKFASRSASSSPIRTPAQLDASDSSRSKENKPEIQDATKMPKPKGKLKNERSMKDLTGALARFWVG